MCGIAGIFNTSGDASRNGVNIHKMAQSMVCRGPDDEGYMIVSDGSSKVGIFGGNDTPPSDSPVNFFPRSDIEDAYDVEGFLFLAHRRLSIIDLSPYGHQPMATPDGRYWIVYNGEIYNFQEIRQDLKARGVEFTPGHSDTEVVLNAYKQWGVDALQKFNGMFAFAVWDGKRKELFCARDRIGIKPFYYTFQNDKFIFASDIKGLIASGLYQPAVDMRGLYHALSFGVAPRPMTSFEGVKELEQGCWMRVDVGGHVKKGKYWQIPVGVQDDTMSEHDAVELIESELKQAVRRRLVADVPVGTFMSGGIDSTTVSVIASQEHPGIKAFTLAFLNDRKLNELDQARATASMYSMEHIVKEVYAEDVLDHIDDIVECYEEPFYDLSPNYIVSQFAHEHDVPVILNGLGGDELFAGYPYYAWLKKWALMRKLKFPLALASSMPFAGHISRRFHAMSKADTAGEFAVAVRTFLTDSEKHKLFVDVPSDWNTVEAVNEMYKPENFVIEDGIEGISHMDMMNYIGNHHVYRVDKFTMRFSIESRLPLLDHELVEAACRVPSKYKIRNGQRKYILRKVAEGKIHESCLAMKKKGFDFPTSRWMRGPLKQLVQEKLKALGERDILRPEAIQRVYNDWICGARSYRGVWQLVSLELWYEKFIEKIV